MQKFHWTYTQVYDLTLPQIISLTTDPEETEREWRYARMNAVARATADYINGIYGTF